MLVVIANNLPPAVRGRLKLWFIEPRPGIFVSGIKDNVANKVIDYILQYCPESSGIIMFQKIGAPPGYRIIGQGLPHRKLLEISGLQLVHEKDTL